MLTFVQDIISPVGPLPLRLFQVKRLKPNLAVVENYRPRANVFQVHINEWEDGRDRSVP